MPGTHQKRSQISPTPPSMCPQTHTPIAINNILQRQKICNRSLLYIYQSKEEIMPLVKDYLPDMLDISA